MRKDVTKLLFVGPSSKKEEFFKKAQEFGLIQFIDASNTSQYEVMPDLERLTRALKIMRGIPHLDQQHPPSYDEADSIADSILQAHSILEKKQEEERVLKLEIARVEPFGHFSPEELHKIEQETNRKFRFYWARHAVFHTHDLPENLVYITSDHSLDYFIALSKDPIQQAGLFEMRVEEPVNVVGKRYKEAKAEIEAQHEELKKLTVYSDYLHHAAIEKLNQNNLYTTQNYVEIAMDGMLFAVEGWVPVDKVEVAKKLADEEKVHYEEVPIEEKDVVPTYLENTGAARVGEDLVHIYDTPSNTDKDPSLWVLFFFALFFAIIINDAGYGLVFLAIAFYMRYKHQKMTALGYRMWKLTGILAIACVIWGVLDNSYFGIEPELDSPVMKYSAVNWLIHKKVNYHREQNDETWQMWTHNYPQIQHETSSEAILMQAHRITPNGAVHHEMYAKFSDHILMELALLIGMVHIIISLVRYLPRNWANLGWIMFIIGCYLYFPTYLGATTMLQFIGHISKASVAHLGIFLIFAGIAWSTIFSIYVHKWTGIFEIMTVIQVFSDVLSYLRLYALAMAGAIMAATVNDGYAAVGGGILGALIIAVGHFFNIILSVMGGVIHGLRLNFLEWYHYSFEGGGKPFKPLEKLKIE